MGFISEILGISRSSSEASKPRGIGEVEAALARLREERSTAKEGIADAMRTRDALLVVDETDKKIAALDAAADRHRLTLERCEKLEPILLEELASLRNEAKRKRWLEISVRYDVEARAFAGAFRATLERWQSLIAIRGEAQNSGFASEAGALIVPPYMLSQEMLDRFEAELDRQRDFAARKPEPKRQPAPTPPPQPKKPPPAAAPRKDFAHRPESFVAPSAGPQLDETENPAQMFRKRNRELSRLGEAPLPEGQVGVRLLKSGIEIDGAATWRGDEIAVPALQGRRLVENSAAEYIDPAPKSAPPPAAVEPDALR